MSVERAGVATEILRGRLLKYRDRRAQQCRLVIAQEFPAEVGMVFTKFHTTRGPVHPQHQMLPSSINV